MTILKNDGAALKGIEELRGRDIAASKAYDAEALASLWTEDAVTLAPGQPPTYGREAIRAKLAGVKAAAAQMEVIEYAEVFEETLIFGDHAIEWGCIRGAERMRSGGPVQESRFKVMRVLKRQPDGSWLFHRSIYNEAPAEYPAAKRVSAGG